MLASNANSSQSCDALQQMTMGYIFESSLFRVWYVLWAQDERPADLHMAQPNVPVSKTGHNPPATDQSTAIRGSQLFL
jgi:hypothetical protein